MVEHIIPALHFVGFRGDYKGQYTTGNDYLAAVRVWGKPDFVHISNDARSRREIHETDTVIYARGCESRPSERNHSDLVPQDPENGV